jgi:uncharacterized cupin superfamily protein
MAAPRLPAFDPFDVAESNASMLPEPFATMAKKRYNRKLGDHAGLTRFGVNLTRLEPGGMSSQRHAHLTQDEFVWVLEGEAVLVTNDGRQTLSAGTCVGFAHGTGDAHHFLNESDGEVLLLVVGDRTPGEVATYPDVDLLGRMDAAGRYSFTHKDGSSY